MNNESVIKLAEGKGLSASSTGDTTTITTPEGKEFIRVITTGGSTQIYASQTGFICEMRGDHDTELAVIASVIGKSKR